MKLWKLSRAVKFWWQRRTRGFDDSALWNLDQSLAKLIAPRLRAFRGEYTNKMGGHPAEIPHEEWDKHLGKMIGSFEFYADGLQYTDLEAWKKHNEGLELFAKWFGALWD